MRVLITGATGFVGSFLTGLLVARGDRVSLVSREPERLRDGRSSCEVVGWLPELDGFDAVVNLAGEPIFGQRWTEGFKARLRESRLDATRRVAEALAAARDKPRALVSASAVGYYGDRGDDVLTEGDPAATDFLGDLCRQWEQAAGNAEQHGVRTVLLRTGIVLGHGGALEKMLPPFKLGLGGPLGSGKQWMSWIHIKDLCRLILHAIDDEALAGPLNGTAPEPLRNKAFGRALGKVLGRPAFMPLPGPMLRLAVGGAASLLTDSQRCSADKALGSGFEFEFGELDHAFTRLLKH